MSLTHSQVIEDAEASLLDALITQNMRKLGKIVHPEIVFTDESGQTFIGLNQLPYMNSEVLRLDKCEVGQRSITLFTNIAVVNCTERRSGFYRTIFFEREFRVTRIWKFSGRQWQLISATLVILPATAQAVAVK